VETPTRPRLALAGGCGSSGTTLLAHLLGRHPAVVAAPEFDLFNHPEALSLAALRESAGALFERRRLSDGYKLVVGFVTPAKAVGIERATLERWLADAATLEEFYASVAGHMCAARGAACFVEKTPTNVYNFEALAKRMPELPLIHQIRDGRDVAASLVRRGKTLFYAGSRWLYDTLRGLRARGSPSYIETRYEALVLDPEATLRTILAHLRLEYDPCVLDPDRGSSASSYDEAWRDKRSAKRWQSTPGDPISRSSIGKFRDDLTPDQLSTLYRIRLTAKAADELAAPVRSVAELLEYLDYDTGAAEIEAAGPALRLRELRGEIADHAYRVGRSLRYTKRLPAIVTTVGR
jgi:hypothetical protein